MSKDLIKGYSVVSTLPPSVPVCPFCGAQPTIERWHGGGPQKHMVSCRNASCYVRPNVTGGSRYYAIRNWSIRA